MGTLRLFQALLTDLAPIATLRSRKVCPSKD